MRGIAIAGRGETAAAVEKGNLGVPEIFVRMHSLRLCLAV